MKFCNLRVEARASLPGFRRQTIVSNWYPQSSLFPRSLLELYSTSSVIFCMRLFSYHAITYYNSGSGRSFSSNVCKIEQRKWHNNVFLRCSNCKVVWKMQYPSKALIDTHCSIFNTITSNKHIFPKPSNLPSPKTQNSLQPNRAQWKIFHNPFPSKNLHPKHGLHDKTKITSQSHIRRANTAFPPNSSETKPATPTLKTRELVPSTGKNNERKKRYERIG